MGDIKYNALCRIITASAQKGELAIALLRYGGVRFMSRRRRA
ncbi:hypothetical protein [Inquilinus limosus]|nr:hypothetical protein [Inquilinus limosus]